RHRRTSSISASPGNRDPHLLAEETPDRCAPALTERAPLTLAKHLTRGKRPPRSDALSCSPASRRNHHALPILICASPASSVIPQPGQSGGATMTLAISLP
ncbi:MAG: hypothetical protein ABI593_07915, partial [Betaproteobacteria bacterium]